MQKPGFGVVTSVVAVLTVVAFLSKLAIGLIPSGPENRLASEPSEFLQQASHEQIDWRTLTEETFTEARKKDKPIMLVVGSACSLTGRSFDRFVFTAKEVRGFLARNYICARVDGMANPEYVNAFLPISRAIARQDGRLAIPPDFQVWFLDPKGYLFGYAAERNQSQLLDAKTFLVDLTDAANRYERFQKSTERAGEDQRRDLAVINAPIPQQLPDLAGFGAYLSSAIPQGLGGFPTNGFQRLMPEAWRFQLIAGRWADYTRSMAPCVTSPQVDLLDGGFFTDAASLNWHSVGFDKLAVTNAAMMHTLALGSILMKDDQQRWLALRTFDSLLTQFPQEGLIAAGQIGDETELGRSARSGFSPRKLRELFPDDADREWVRINLGLRVETNPQMMPMLAQLDLPTKDRDRFEEVLTTLRKDRPVAKFAGLAQLDVGGYATARMMQTARILGDKDRLVKAEGLFERLDEFRTLNDVVHSHAVGARPHAFLGDYLAYADGALQYFLATGNESAFDNGLAVLRRGLFLFGSKVPGVFNLSQPASSPLAPQDAAAPEIVDNVRESCTAQVIRLCNDYGRLLGRRGSDLAKIAGDGLTRFAGLSGGLGQFAGGYFCAAAEMEDPVYAIAVGRNALADSLRLARLAPSRLVAPPIGGAALHPKGPGLYVIRSQTVTGPLTVEKAAEMLRRAPL